MDEPAASEQGALNVKTTLIPATCVAALVAILAANSAVAQKSAAPAGPSGGTAVVDISYIFKYHGRFKQGMEGLKSSVEAAEAEFKKEKKAIEADMEKVQQFKPGSAEYKRGEEDIARKQSEFQVKVSLKKKELAERESKIYFNVYQEVSDEVKYYADKNGISLVLRFNGDPVDVNNRESVLREINKPIVYQKGIDITPIILDALNRHPKTTSGTATGPKGGHTK
jgi:Skp family chaperone for outer membrane proteins